MLLRTVIGAQKCLFAAGPGAHIVTYVCATGGKNLRVLNGGGHGGCLLELSTLRPEDLGGTGKPKCGGEVRLFTRLLVIAIGWPHIRMPHSVAYIPACAPFDSTYPYGIIRRPKRQAQEVVLDSTNGDFYSFDFKTDRWNAVGNMGIQKIKGGIGGVAAAILADASGDFGGNDCMKKVR